MAVQKKLLETLKGAQFATPPVWLMRQAGRYLPEYRALRQQAGDFLSLCYNPELACAVTLQPIERFGFDAAILFSDILVIPHALGQKLWFAEGEGPHLAPKLTTQTIESLAYRPELLQPVYQAIKNLVCTLPDTNAGQTALIGFAGSPWTLATYMVAGGTSKDHAPARLMAYEHPEHFQALIDILVTASFDYLSRQIQSGVEVVQIFDSWAGVLPKQQFEAWVIAPTTQLVAKLKAKHPEVPIIGFPRGAGTKALDYVYKTGVDALGIDEQADRDYLALNLPKNFPVQGNLDPALLHAGGNALVAEVHAIMQTFKNRPHIFNLGHGIWPTTPIPHVEALLTCLRGQA